MNDVTRRSRRRLVVALAGCWLIAPALLAAARWPSWWAWIAPEQTPMTWLQSVALVLAAAAALLAAQVLQLRDVRPSTDPAAASASRNPGRATGSGAWRMLAAGLVALAVDERFALHERVRDGILAPRDVTVPFLPWVGPGDFLLLAVGVVGLAVLPVVWRAMGDDYGARRALVLGVGLAVVAVGMDSIDPTTWTAQAERVQQTTEEVIEYGSGLALLAAVALRLLGLLDTAIARDAQAHGTTAGDAAGTTAAGTRTPLAPPPTGTPAPSKPPSAERPTPSKPPRAGTSTPPPTPLGGPPGGWIADRTSTGRPQARERGRST
jgi:hypothetical protein